MKPLILERTIKMGDKMNDKYTNINRQNNFDLLRILSTFAVIIIHANATIANDNNISLVGYNAQNLINVITRFSVPCFVMMSGAFILNDNKNADYKRFYAKSFYKIGIPLIIFSIVTIGLSEFSAIMNNGNLLAPLVNLLAGDFSNYWFMFMLIGLYFLAPIIIRIRATISNKTYCIVSIIWLVIACISQSTSTYQVSYSFGVVFAFLAFFLIGNVIYENCRKMKKFFSVIFVFGAICVFTLTYVIRCRTGFSLYVVNPYTSWFSPLIVVASILLFIGFANMRVDINCSKLSSTTFIIYLFHTKVYLAVIALFKRLIPQITNHITIFTLIVSAVALAISFLLSVVYLRIWNWLEKKLNWKEKWNQKFNI